MRLRSYISKHISPLVFGNSSDSSEGTMMTKTYEGTDDSFFAKVSEKMQQTFKIGEESRSYKRDLKRYGTKPGVIDVAEDAKPKYLLPLKKATRPKRFADTYIMDLNRFGTRPGIIDVANDEKRKKKSKKSPAKDFSKALYNSFINKWKVKDTTPYSANPFADIYREFPKSQVTIRNTSTEDREVLLWGSKSLVNAGPPAPEDVAQHTITTQISAPTGIHPQGIVVNPANELIYVANQLSGTVSVLNGSNTLVQSIQLLPTFPGLTSPVSLAVNSNPASSTYGFVFVACSVSNTIAVIDLSFSILASIPCGVRPVAVTFNPVNGLVYAANLVSDNVTVIDAEALTETSDSPLTCGQDPIGVGTNPLTGDVFVTNSLDNNVSVFNALNALVTTIPAVGVYPVSATYNPANNSMYVAATKSNSIYQINPTLYSIMASIPTGNRPYNSFFNSLNNFLYVQNREDNTFTVIRPDNTTISGLTLGEQNIGGTFNSFNNFIYVSDTTNNRINAIGYLTTSSPIVFSENYSEMNEEFKSNPAILQHVKFVVTGSNRLNSFRFNRFTPTGSVTGRAISFELYASPQSKMNVAEVNELAGTIIDRKMNWRFLLPGLHTVSILVWYRQFELREILNQNIQ